jgi:hypothetical protein
METMAGREEGSRILIYTENELDWMMGHRPSLARAVNKNHSHWEKNYSAADVHGQVKVDLSRLLQTVDKAVTDDFASAGVVESKHRALRRIALMLKDGPLMSRLNWVMARCYSGESGYDDTLIALKELALNYLASKPFLIANKKTQVIEPTSELAWMNDMMNTLLGDDSEGKPLFRNAVLYGSHARFLRGEKIGFKDKDFFVFVGDYRTAIERLRGKKMSHDGKPVNVVLVPESSSDRFVGIKPDSVVQISEGLATNGGVEMPLPNRWSMGDGMLAHIAARHNTLKGMTAAFPSVKGTLVSCPELLASFAKTPLLNQEAFMMKAGDSYVPRREVEEKYASFIDTLKVQDPRTIEVVNEKDAARVMALSNYIDSRLILRYA